MKIGIIGAGHIGGIIAELLVQSGHDITVSSRHIETLTPLVEQLGSHGCKASIEDTANYNEIIVLAIPLGGIRETGGKIANYITNKIVIDVMNPFIERDGDIAKEIIQSGLASGEATQIRFPFAKIVRAFNNIRYVDLKTQSHRFPNPVAVPFATDHDDAKGTIIQLIKDAGYEPYFMGKLKDSKPQDPGGVLFGKALTVRQISELLK